MATQINRNEIIEALVDLIKSNDLTWVQAITIYREETGDSIRECHNFNVDKRLRSALNK